jgi:hypothetical protein
LPRYFFAIRFHDLKKEDASGTTLPDNKAALEFALRTVRQLKEGGRYDHPGLALIVENEAGEKLFTIPF